MNAGYNGAFHFIANFAAAFQPKGLFGTGMYTICQDSFTATYGT